MKIVSLLDNRNSEVITYSYTKRHTDIPYYPDNACEKSNLPQYDKSNGSLFYDKEVSWKGEKLLNGSIDINVSLPSKKFIDHIGLRQGKSSKIGSIDIFTVESDTLKKIAVFTKNCCIDDEYVKISVGYFCDNIIIRLNACFEGIAIRNLEIIAAEEIENAIYPVPESIEEKTGELSFSKIKTVTATCDEALSAVTYISEKLSDKLGINTVTGDNGEIIFKYVERNDDGYEINVDDDKCEIKAGNKRAFIYAADTFLQLSGENGFSACIINDKPFMEIRGVHVALPSKKNLPFLRKLIKDLWVPMKYNTVFLQLSGAMRYDCFPEISEKWLLTCEKYEKGEWPQPSHYDFIGHDTYEKDEVRELCAYIRSFGLEIVPEIQSFAHAQYVSAVFPELAEIERDDRDSGSYYDADEKPDAFYPHNLCPNHERYYEIFFKIIDEVVEVVQPERFLHMGHDEIYVHGKCEKCAEMGSAKVYAEEVTKLNEYIKSKNLTMAIWSDMLQKETYSVPEAINDVPKDIVMFDFTWYFHPEEDLEDNLLSHGFNVVMGNMNSSHYTRFTSRSKKPGIIGAEVSTWVWMTEHSYAYEGKMYEFAYAANMMWSAKYDDTCRLSYDEIVQKRVWDVRRIIGELDLTGEISHPDFGGEFKNVPNELIWHIPYDKAAVVTHKNEVEITVNGMADVVSFAQATDLSADRVMWKPAEQIGEYEFIYEDGVSVAMPIYYGVSIMQYNRRYATPLESFLFRHQGYIGTYMSKPICGKDSNGRDYTLYDYPIKNPHPNKKIKKIVARHMKNTDAKILLFDVRAIKN